MSGIKAGDALGAEREEKFAVVRELEHLLKGAIGDPHVVVAIHAKAVRLKETILSPRGKEFAGSSIETEDRGRGNGVRFVCSPGIFGAVKEEDVIVRIDCDTRDLAQHETRWKLWPTVDDGIWLTGARLLSQRERGNRSKRDSQKGDASKESTRHT
jgi:hypothetical protein